MIMKIIILIVFILIGFAAYSQRLGLVASNLNARNILKNGNFSNGSTGWTLNSGWSIANGKITGVDVTTLATGTVNTPPIDGVIYLVKFTVSNWTKNTIAMRVGGTNSQATGSGDGDYSVQVTSGADGTFSIDGLVTFSGDIDNIRVEKQ